MRGAAALVFLHIACGDAIPSRVKLLYSKDERRTGRIETTEVGMQPVQLKMARAALGLSVDEVASKAGVSPADVTHLERGDSAGATIIGRLRAIYEDAGIAWIGQDGVRYAGQADAGIVPLEELNSANDE